MGVVYEQEMADGGDDGDPLAFLREIAAARYYQVNMLKRDILRREKRNIGLRADAEVKRLDLQFKLDVERDLEVAISSIVIILRVCSLLRCPEILTPFPPPFSPCLTWAITQPLSRTFQQFSN